MEWSAAFGPEDSGEEDGGKERYHDDTHDSPHLGAV